MMTYVIMISMTMAIFFVGDDDDVHCKISNICEDMKSAKGSSQKAAGVDFDFQIVSKVFA